MPSVSSTRPWHESDGDPARPTSVNGLAVLTQLRTRRDGVPGALVELEDGRYAVTGPVVIIGRPQAITRGAQQRLARAPTHAEGAWWREVIGAVAAAPR
jgi:cell volume regulation protein A